MIATVTVEPHGTELIIGKDTLAEFALRWGIHAVGERSIYIVPAI